MKKPLSNLLISLLLVLAVAGCSTPEEKAEKYYQKGMSLLDSNPEKAKLEFQNALQLKKNMTKAMYGLALTTEKQGDMKATFALMNEVLQQDPQHIDAMVKVGQIFLAGGRTDMALDKSKKALEIDQYNVSAMTLRAAVQLKLDDPNGAVEFATAALKRDPNNQDAYVVLATERLGAKDEGKALELLDKALKINEKNLAIQLIKIRAQENLKDLKSAEQTYKKIIELFPNTVFAKKNYALFLLKYSRKEEAEQQIRNISKDSPDNNEAKLDVVKFVLAAKGTEAGQAELENYCKTEPENYELAFELVNLYRLQNSSEKEDKLLNQIIKQAGTKPEAFRARGLIAQKLIRTGKKEEAVRVLDTILVDDKTNQLALTLRASLAIEDKNYDSAISDLRTVLRDSPDASGAAYMLAIAHESAGSHELAEEQYQKAYETGKFASAYGIPYAQFLNRQKQPERAEKILQNMLELNPNETAVVRYLAQTKIARGDYAGAEALANKQKDNVDNKALQAQILGDISSGKKDFEASINAFKRAHEAAPKDPRPVVDLVRTYLQAGRPKEAITFVESTLKTMPDNIDAKLMLAQLHSANNDKPKAIEMYTEVIKAQPKITVAYQQLSAIQLGLKQYDDAANTVIQGLSNAPNDFNLKLTQANVFEAKGRYDEAIKIYEELLIDKPKSTIVANNLANLILDHRTDDASMRRAYELAKPLKTSDLSQYLDTYGWASYKLAKLDDAEKSISLAIEKAPEIAVFHYHLAKVYVAKNDKDKAKLSLKKSLQLAANQPFDQQDEADALLKTL
jgi:cellulose synthase operon protein C